jgi:hypothetical protein
VGGRREGGTNVTICNNWFPQGYVGNSVILMSAGDEIDKRRLAAYTSHFESSSGVGEKSTEKDDRPGSSGNVI